jgi:glycosyltransferase involved in cell wall biosynthesis
LNPSPNDTMKRITVIAPARNATAFYLSWLRAIEVQKYERLEAILIDDGSKDYDAPDGLRALAEKAPPFVRYMRTEGVGPAEARNLAINASESEYLAFLDLDDLWAPGHLQRLVSVLEANPEAGIVQGQIRKIMTGDNGELLYCSNPYNFVNLGSAVYRRSVFEQAGLFDPTLRFGEDFDHIVRCWELGIIKIVLPDVSLLYHRHDGNMTNGKSTVDLGAVRVYKRRLDRMRQGLVDPALVAKRQVNFGDYLGTTVGPFDEGVRELVEL